MGAIAILNELPVWMLALLIIGASVSFSIGLQLLTRRQFGADVLAQNHEVAGFKFAVVGVAYAVLLAFVVIVVWNDFDRAQQSVFAEAERIYNLQRTSYTFSEETGIRIRRALRNYVNEVREKDWPLMERGLRGSPSASKALVELSRVVGQTKPENLSQLPSVSHSFSLMQQIADLRLERLSAVDGRVTPVIWWILMLGAVINLGYPAFFATKNVCAQVLMTGGLAAIIGGTLFLTIILNYPFSGPVRLSPAPISDIIDLIQIENETVIKAQ